MIIQRYETKRIQKMQKCPSIHVFSFSEICRNVPGTAEMVRGKIGHLSFLKSFFLKNGSNCVQNAK